MSRKSDGIRKAAILVASLDEAAAERLLDQMDPRQAKRVRQALLELGHVDPQEQRAIVEEFFRVGPPAPPKQPPGVELDASLAARLALDEGRSPPGAEMRRAPEEGRPFRFLQQAEDARLAKVLAGERPQTIALVLAHLAPEQAGAVLSRFAPAVQVEVVRRLVDLEETQPEILREVERALEARLSEQVHIQRRRVAGLPAVAAILEASGTRIGMQILDNLASHDEPLAEKLGPDRMEFAELMLLDDRTLSEVLRAADPEELVLALVGAPSPLVERMLRPLPEREAAAVRQRLDHPGPTRLSDVEEARQRIADLARRLSFARRLDSGRASGSRAGATDKPTRVAA